MGTVCLRVFVGSTINSRNTGTIGGCSGSTGVCLYVQIVLHSQTLAQESGYARHVCGKLSLFSE